MDSEPFRSQLLTLQAEITEELKQAEVSTAPVELDQALQGRLSRIDAMQQQEMAKATQVRRKQQLVKIKQALKRIDEGDFGYCMRCDEEIGAKRLKLNPTVLTCINCAA